jgi:hypothetical protein
VRATPALERFHAENSFHTSVDSSRRIARSSKIQIAAFLVNVLGLLRGNKLVCLEADIEVNSKEQSVILITNIIILVLSIIVRALRKHHRGRSNKHIPAKQEELNGGRLYLKVDAVT